MPEPTGSITTDFYDSLPIQNDFPSLTDRSAYRPVPDDWFVGAADIVGSTRHIEAGRYKMVNTAGAAVISAQINAAKGGRFPYVFGGDGATFAFPARQADRVRDALARVIRWARDEFDFEMRGAIVPVDEIRAAGFEVSVARFRPSPNVDYAMFSGGGVAWAERRMKAGSYGVQAAGKGAFPDLTGLSCRWTPMRSKKGKILSVLAIPLPEAEPEAVARAMRRIVEMTRRLERDGHPVPGEGPGYRWPPQGLELEAHATRGKTSLALRKAQLLFETFLAWLFFRTGVKAGGFDPGHYIKTTGDNADFRKFEDGLKMTLDIDEATRGQLEQALREAADAGLLTYGLFEQDEAIMTCIVPSVTSDDHVHFVDGASGGYTSAALAIKNVGRYFRA